MEILKLHLGCIIFTIIIIFFVLFGVIIPLFNILHSQFDLIKRLNNYLDLYLDEGFIRQDD